MGIDRHDGFPHYYGDANECDAMNRRIFGLTTLLITTAVLADPATITGGVAGGAYQVIYGANLVQILKAKGHDVKLLESRGSMENLQRLGNGEAQLGFA